MDFLYAQTNDAFGQIETVNVHTGEKELIGSWNERFAYTDEDIEAYLAFARERGYRRIYLAGHSLGANKVLSYLSRHHQSPVEKFILLSPANLSYMMSGVTAHEKDAIRTQVAGGRGCEMLPFPFMGWVQCIADTAHDWAFSTILNVAHTSENGNFSVAENVTHTGMLLIGTYDNFTDGDPVRYLQNLNRHMPRTEENELVYIERTGHTCQQKEQEMADRLTETVANWLNAAPITSQEEEEHHAIRTHQDQSNNHGRAGTTAEGRALHVRARRRQPPDCLYRGSGLGERGTRGLCGFYRCRRASLSRSARHTDGEYLHRYANLPDWGVGTSNFDCNHYM